MTGFRAWFTLFLATFGLVFSPAISRHGQHAQTTPGPYTLIDLGTLGGAFTQPSDMNNEGQIVGYSTTASSHSRGFLWDNGNMSALGTLSDGNASWAAAVNGLGHVVGSSSTRNGFTRAVLWRDDLIVNLTPDIPVYEGWSNAAGINDSGQIVGAIDDIHGFLLDNGTRVMLGDLGGGGSRPAAINNAGQVVGSSYTTMVNDQGATPHAFLWQNGAMTDLGVLAGDDDSGAAAINSYGVVVGSSGHTDPVTYETRYRPFIYANGTITAIPAPSVEAYAADINDDGAVVGTMRAGGGLSSWHAWIYVDGVVTNLNSLIPAGSGLHLAFAEAINNLGQITGVAYDAQGRYHGFLLTPGESSDAVVPAISINDVEKSEGRNGTTAFAFAVQLSVATTVTVRVNFATANGSATAGQDYTGTAGTLVFNPGDTTKTVVVAVNGDRTREPDETFTVNLSAAEGGMIFDAQGLGTIRNDDR